MKPKTDMKAARVVTIACSLLFCFIFQMNTALYAQNGETLETIDEDLLLGELSPDQIQILNTPADNNTSGQVVLQQTGTGNTVMVDQLGPGNMDLSQVIVIQDGTYNEADIQQNGSGNSSNLIQTGNGNQYRLSMEGADNRTLVQQEGDGNVINQDLTGDDLHYILIQRGNGNEVIQTENSADTRAPAYQLEQSGNGMRIEISQGKILQ